jgi:ABC-type branched-subunit amino acid transport system ATPase component
VSAVDGVSIRFSAGDITAVVGANGAGKTTFLNCLSGNVTADSGQVVLGDREITKLPPWRRARLGVFRGFQDSELFAEMTVRDTARIACYSKLRYSLADVLLPTGRARRIEASIALRVKEALEIVGLTRYSSLPVNEASLGMRRLVQIACAIAANAAWLLLDEPAAGVAKAEVNALGPLLRRTVNFRPDIGIVLVEHDGRLIEACADRVVLLDHGRVASDDRPVTGGDPKPSYFHSHSGTGDGFTQRVEHADDNVGLEAKGVTVRYGKFEAVTDTSLAVVAGRIHCLVGTNGAGKSSLLGVLAGEVNPASGDVFLDGVSISALPPHSRVDRGIVLVPAGRGLLPRLTVAENLHLAELHQRPVHDSERLPKSVELFPELRSKMGQFAGTLSGGEQQMLALARALTLHPRFLLIDELSLGLHHVVVDRLVDALRWLADLGIGLLVVEQNPALALAMSERAYVMAQGKVVFSGPAAVAASQPELFAPIFLGS